MIKEIITDYDELSGRSEEINTRKDGDKFRAVILDLKDTIIDKGLLGLSAPQIGVPIRVFSISFKGRRKVFVNPLITSVEQFTFSRETSPCLPGKEYIVPRYGKIQAGYFDPLGKIQNVTLMGAGAYIFQQLVDSLDGILLSDIGMEIDEDFDKATEDEKAELLRTFADSLDIKVKELKEEISADPVLSKLDENIDFLNAVNEGKVTFEQEDNPQEKVDEPDKN